MRVGIVCEGRTDFLLLEQVVLAVFGPCEIHPLQPLRDQLNDTRWTDAGWSQVKQWCAVRGAEGIADERAIGGLDVIVLHVDGDMCGRDGLPASRQALCDLIKSEWIGAASPPQGTIICIPAPATDAWLVAALDPTLATPLLEADADPLAHLVRLGVLRPAPAGEASPRKNQYEYRLQAPHLGARSAALRRGLPELHRFMTKLEAFAP